MSLLRSATWLTVVTISLVTVTGCTGTTTNQTTTKNTSQASNTATVYSEDAIDVVTTDAYGKDFDWLERYPDSIRSYYIADDASQSVSYQTTATTTEVREYYTDKLTDQGWKQSGDATDYVEFSKGDEENPDLITIWLTDYSDQGIVEYEIDYERALTEAELNAEDAE